MKKWILISTIYVGIFVQQGFAEKSVPEVVGSISSVIVYQGQALVTRTIELDLPKGGSEVIVQKLPERIVSESLYAQGSDGVTVASVRYRQKETGEDKRAEVKELESKIEQVVKQQYQAQRDWDISAWLFNHFEAQWGLSINAANADLNRGVLQFEPIHALSEYLEIKAAKYHENNVKIEFQKKDLEKELGELQRKLDELKAGTSKVEREAVLFINSPSERKVTIQLSYLVNNASWLPQHNLRANPNEGKVLVEYSALMHQASGEDWNGIAISLSTAKPTMVASPPVLEPMKVRLGSGAPEIRGAKYTDRKDIPMTDAPEQVRYRDLSEEFRRNASSRLEMSQKGQEAERALNVVALDNQMVELQVDKNALQTIQAEAKRFARSEGVSVTYNLGTGFTMPSRSDQELITIAAFQTKGEFTMIATPLLTDYVYLQADVINDSNVILLAGSANMYRDGEFVGKGRLEMVTIGQRFTVGFGVDSQIKITREIKDKKIDTLWGNRVDSYDYRIAIDNYKNTDVKLRLLERIPYTEEEGLKIENFKTNISLSGDREYLRTEKEKGLLRWDLNLKPATTEKNATVVTYSYSMKYDNDMHIQSVPIQR